MGERGGLLGALIVFSFIVYYFTWFNNIAASGFYGPTRSEYSNIINMNLYVLIIIHLNIQNYKPRIYILIIIILIVIFILIKNR